jgi:outer membrane protein assembly factor BamB
MKGAFESIALVVLIMAVWTVGVFAAGQVTALDDGNLYLFVSNNGTFAFDSSASRSGYAGLYYPKNTDRWVMSGGGIWVAGKKGDEWRVTISLAYRLLHHSQHTKSLAEKITLLMMTIATGLLLSAHR